MDSESPKNPDPLSFISDPSLVLSDLDKLIFSLPHVQTLQYLTDQLSLLSTQLVNHRLSDPTASPGDSIPAAGEGNDDDGDGDIEMTSARDSSKGNKRKKRDEDAMDEDEPNLPREGGRSSLEYITPQYLFSATPLFSLMKTVNRENATHCNDCKERVREVREETDRRNLRLQNLLYERSHLEKEIKKCEEFESEYASLPLHPLQVFCTLRQNASPPQIIPQDPHDLMMARLKFELQERKRLEGIKKGLLGEKTKLVRENEAKKRRLDELEGKLDGFVESAKEIQTQMQTFK